MQFKTASIHHARRQRDLVPESVSPEFKRQRALTWKTAADVAVLLSVQGLQVHRMGHQDEPIASLAPLKGPMRDG